MTLRLLKFLIQFSTFIKEGQEQPRNSVYVTEVLKELQIQPNWYNISKMTFPKPNEFFHLFVNNPEEFEEYLKFLIELSKKTTIKNEQVVYHNIFEFYIQKYD